MINSEQIQALRAAAEKAKLSQRRGGMEMAADSYDFIAMTTPQFILSLLAERDADKSLIAESVLLFETLRQRIAELEQKHCGGALMKREEHHVGVVNKLLERIAELEGALNLASASYAGERERADALQARTVKLPESFTKSMYGTPLYEHVDIVAMLAAAGITLDVGE